MLPADAMTQLDPRGLYDSLDMLRSFYMPDRVVRLAYVTSCFDWAIVHFVYRYLRGTFSVFGAVTQGYLQGFRFPVGPGWYL